VAQVTAVAQIQSLAQEFPYAVGVGNIHTQQKEKHSGQVTKDIFFSLFRAAPTAHGSSQTRGQIRATAGGLHHSHSNARSQAMSATYTTAHRSANP